MAHIEVDIDIEDHLDEVHEKYLVKELLSRKLSGNIKPHKEVLDAILEDYDLSDIISQFSDLDIVKSEELKTFITDLENR